MRIRYPRMSLLVVVTLVASLVPAVIAPAAAAADGHNDANDCRKENHLAIALRVDKPEHKAEVAVDEHGKIAVKGIVNKHATMVDVVDGEVTATDFTLSRPSHPLEWWADAWTTSLRPPNLGENTICVRAERHYTPWTARIPRSFTVVDRIPPSAVPGLVVGNISPTGAKVTWGAATDNYGLAGYSVTVDGGTAHRTSVGTRSFTVSGLAPSSTHTVSVVAVDLAGNTSVTPATATFTTLDEPTPPTGDLAIVPHDGSATTSWHPQSAEATYRMFLDEEPLDEFSLTQYCQNAAGAPADPCTAADTISVPVGPLEEGTPYTVRVEGVAVDGTLVRSLSSEFTTTVSAETVPTALTQQVASESTQCAGAGGDFYVSPTSRTAVPLPAGSTPVFDGCYTVSNDSCLEDFLPPSGDKALDCTDDLTALLFDVAPANGGPVLASLSDVTTRAPGDVLIEPITWCVRDETCTIVLTTAVEAAPLVLEAAAIAAEVPAAAISISWLVVLGGGIALGLVLVGVIEALFPGEIGINGILEYPIHFDDDFGTFTNWYADEGEWYNSLKIYAEVVRTANEVAARDGLPFAWNSTADSQLKRIIDAACSVQRGVFPATNGCGDGFAVYVPGAANYKSAPMPQTGAHIVTAMGNGSFPQPPARNQWFYPARSAGGAAARAAGFNRNWYYTPAFATNNPCVPRQPATTCDEFPFWSTNQAVNLTGIVADVLPVSVTETVPQRDDVIGFYNKCKVKDTNRYIVLPVKAWVDAGGPSFGFRVDAGGASLCMAPTGP